MAGIYIHIPFCKSKCAYCDFFSNTDISKIDFFLKSLENEIFIRNKYLGNATIETIYFGGGTPSLLTVNQLNNIIEKLYQNFEIIKEPEITLEANPDDLSENFIEKLKKSTSINRLSIGIQSFFDDDLRLMNRRHNSNQALECIKTAQNFGFENISADLIYGLPHQTFEKWENNIDNLLNLNVQHISAYHLTYEKGTNFYQLLKSKKIQESDENISFELFRVLIEKTQKRGFEHYEISNFAKPPYYSKHNSNYWKQKKYIGFGPSAHSFDLKSRQWNFADMSKYFHYLEKKKLPCEIEYLDENTVYNEYIMTSLRTKWGINLDYIKNKFSSKYYDYLLKSSKKYFEQNLLQNSTSHLILTTEGLFISDSIIADFFFIE